MTASQSRIVLATARGMFTALEVTGSAGQDAPLVLIAHGFPDDHANLAPLAATLAHRGYRAVVPVMRGYEPTTQGPGLVYPSQLADDVVAWMDALRVERAHLIGHDWGAIAAYAASRASPERMLSIAGLAVPPLQRWSQRLRKVPGQFAKSWYMGFFQLPHLPERALQRGLVEKLWTGWSPRWRVSPLALSRAVDRFSIPSVPAHALAYYRALAKPCTREGKRSLELLEGHVHVPTLAVFGIEDGCIDARLFTEDILRPFFSQSLTTVPVTGAGHWLHLEQPLVVSDILGDWLDKHQPKVP